MKEKNRLLIEEAKRWVGVNEEGNNRGKDIEMFQRAVDGKAQNESWCLSFIQYCVKEVGEQVDDPVTCLYPTEHVMTLWNNTPKEARLEQPELGCLILWQHMKDNGPTINGHVGIVIDTSYMDIGIVKTIEGNTSPGSGVEREGDGV